MPPAHIQQWLNQALATYAYKDQTSQAAGSALDMFPSLKVKTDQYTFDDGRTLLLLCIHGTLPIVYSSARYNVPLNVWLPLDYPKSPPLVYVVPTSGMMVRKGRGVALDGKVDEEPGSYLDGWRRKPEAHSILPLLQSLADSFSIQPPVYAKPKTTATSGPQPTQPSSSSPVRASTAPQPQYNPNHETLPTYSRPPQPPPPPPPHGGSPSPHPHPQHSHARQPSYSSGPPAPPLPPSARGNSLPPQSPPRSAPLSPAGSFRPPQWSGPPPHPSQNWSASPQPAGGPPHPGQWASPPPGQQHPPYTQQQPNSSYRPTPPVSQPSPSSSPYQQHAHPQHDRPGPAQQRPPPPNGGYHSPQHSYSQPPPSTYQPQPARPPPVQQSTRPPPPTRQPIEDLMSSPLDTPSPPTGLPSNSQSGGAPPPPPPNPELMLLHSTLLTRLSSTLASHMSSLTTRQNQLLAIRDDLASAPAAIEDEMGRLKAVRDVCIGVGERLGAVVREAEERVGGDGPGGKREEVSVDEVVCSTTIVYNQLIDLVAEDAAISDTLYQLNRALHNEKIDLERFLKATRILAREQFMKRALVERILKG